MHACPMVTVLVPHVGGPILPPGVPTVLVGMLPAATVTNMATCVGPPDVIVMGSMGVFINFLPAARMGDQTAHGGVIVLGEPTVMTGEMGAPSPGAGGAGGVVAGLVASGIAQQQLAIASVLNQAGTQAPPPSTLPPPGIIALVTAEVMNAEMEAQGMTASWAPGTMVTVAVIPAGTQFPQVINPQDLPDILDGLNRFGAWASPPGSDHAPSQDFVRQEQAVLPQFKKDVSTSIMLEITKPMLVHIGIAARMEKMNDQGQMETGRGGGGQLRMLGTRGQLPLKMVGSPKILT